MKRDGVKMARCQVCLDRDGWAARTDNLMLATIDGKEILVCRKDNPNRKMRGSYGSEPESVGN